MICVNFNDSEYKRLKTQALLEGRSDIDFNLDMNIFNTQEGRFPKSIEELNKVIQDFKDRGRMNDAAIKIATIHSPAFSNPKLNVFEFKVVESSDRIKARNEAVKVAEKVMTALNEEFNYPGSPNIARLDTTSTVKVVLEPNQKFIATFLLKETKTQNEEDLKTQDDYNEYYNSQLESELEATQRAEQEVLNLLGKPEEEGGINQFCNN